MPVAPGGGTEHIGVLLVAIATGVALLARWARMPYTVALVIAGLGLGALHVIVPPHLTKELVFDVFLPGLVFEAAFQLRYADVRRDAPVILSLAVPGVGVALFVTAALLTGVAPLVIPGGGFDWSQALVFGSLIAATDPIAVVALFRALGAPRRLATLLEAESLVNDGTAIVFFGLVLVAITGAHTSVVALLIEFVRVVGIGAAIGSVLAYGLCRLTGTLDEPVLEITLTTIAAYGSFALAERLGGSGVIATVAAGLICGNYGARVEMSESTRIATQSFWEYVAFLLNSVIFLLIGFEARLDELVRSSPLVLAALVAVIVARFAVVVTVVGASARTRLRIPASWIGPLTWGGLRGALAMALALSLPDTFRGRELIVTTTYGVVILSITMQGISMSPMLRRLRLTADHDAPRAAD